MISHYAGFVSNKSIVRWDAVHVMERYSDDDVFASFSYNSFKFQLNPNWYGHDMEKATCCPSVNSTSENSTHRRDYPL